MDNKCFITKLPTTVKNDSLPIYGELIIHCTKNGTFRVDYKGDIPNKEIYSDANMLYINNIDSPNGNPQETHVVYNNANYKRVKIAVNTSVLTKSEADVHIPNKYNIIRIDSITAIPIPNGQIPGAITFDLSDIKYLTALTSLNLVNARVTGDISSISNLTALTSLNLSNTRVTGDISSISNLTALTDLNLANTRVTGDISNIVTNCINLKKLYLPKAVTITDEQKKTLTDRGCTVFIDA